MNKQTLIRSTQALAAALLLAAASAHAAPATAQQTVTQLPRVVVTGKAAPAQVVQLPRVVVVGSSVNSQLRQQVLAAAKPAVARPI